MCSNIFFHRVFEASLVSFLHSKKLIRGVHTCCFHNNTVVDLLLHCNIHNYGFSLQWIKHPPVHSFLQSTSIKKRGKQEGGWSSWIPQILH
ncbi:hypothetical protein ZOSMA_180G00270 [Zostera marina]|uniref:Uncharacterized protein n=1 Tax=Zostera marina TaxID=29655 RepID=A0A0K9PR27_ZOSMR|nr:hypothetical protein ZOSMA_180G00270 [Zostera marina]